MLLQSIDTQSGGETGRAQHHALAEAEPGGERHDPLPRHADVFGITAPAVRAHVEAGYDHRIAGGELRHVTGGDDAGRIDAGHVGKNFGDARMAGDRQRVLVVQRRIGHLHDDVAGGQFVDRPSHDLRGDLSGSVLRDEVAAKSFEEHRPTCIDRETRVLAHAAIIARLQEREKCPGTALRPPPFSSIICSRGVKLWSETPSLQGVGLFSRWDCPPRGKSLQTRRASSPAKRGRVL